MPLLTAGEISDMRSEQSGTLPDTGVVWRYTTASDGMGGLYETWAAVGTASCRIGPATGTRETDIASKLTEVDTWTITFPYDQSVNTKDRVKLGTRTFEVVSVSDHEEWETARRVITVEVE